MPTSRRDHLAKYASPPRTTPPPRWTRAVLLVGLTLALLAARGAACECRHTPPATNDPPLHFCNWYRPTSCCLPAHDADINGKFLALIAAGPTCEKYNNRAKLYLAMAFCYGCDPEEPLHFTLPLNAEFFNSTKTVKICRTVSDNLAPVKFGDCGLTLPDDRETICSPNSPVVPAVVWPDCKDGEYVCRGSESKDWYCSASPCPPADVPSGFTGAPCSSTKQTCTGTLKFLNDNRAAKPPSYEDYAVEIVDVAQCLVEHSDPEKCHCMRPAISASSKALPRLGHAMVVGALMKGILFN